MVCGALEREAEPGRPEGGAAARQAAPEPLTRHAASVVAFLGWLALGHPSERATLARPSAVPVPLIGGMPRVPERL